MLKNILNLAGAEQLSKNEQKSINAGGPPMGCYQAWVDLNDVTCGSNGGDYEGSFRLVVQRGAAYCCPI